MPKFADVNSIPFAITKLLDLPVESWVLPQSDEYKEFWSASAPWHGPDHKGWMIGKGHPGAKDQYVVWYGNGKMWPGFGLTIEKALIGAAQDAWKYI